MPYYSFWINQNSHPHTNRKRDPTTNCVNEQFHFQFPFNQKFQQFLTRCGAIWKLIAASQQPRESEIRMIWFIASQTPYALGLRGRMANREWRGPTESYISQSHSKWNCETQTIRQWFIIPRYISFLAGCNSSLRLKSSIIMTCVHAKHTSSNIRVSLLAKNYIIIFIHMYVYYYFYILKTSFINAKWTVKLHFAHLLMMIKCWDDLRIVMQMTRRFMRM